MLHTQDPSIITDRAALAYASHSDPSIVTDKAALPYPSHPASQHHYWQGYPSLCITVRIPVSLLTGLPLPMLHTQIPASLLTRLPFPILHTQHPSIITDKVILPYASQSGSQYHYWQGCPCLCFTSRIPVSLLTRLSFPMLHTQDPSIIPDKVVLPYASHQGC